MTPQKRLTPTKWAETNWNVSHGNTQGFFRPDHCPYQKEILDTIADPNYTDLTLMTSAQIGKTEMMKIIMSYFAVQENSDVIYYSGDNELAYDFGAKVKKSFDRCASIKELWPDARGKLTKDARAIKVLKNGSEIQFYGAKSKSNFNAKTTRVVIFDEVSSYDSLPGRGDPIALGRDRTATYPHTRKHLYVSTPAVSEMCRVEKCWNVSDQRYYLVQCLHCKGHHKLEWESMHWDQESNDPDTAYHECPLCGERQYDVDKHRMLLNGYWNKTRDNIKRHAGFQISELYSTLSTWPNVVTEYLSRKDVDGGMQAFINTKLGLPYVQENAHIKEEILMKRAERYSWQEIPMEVGLLTLAVDTQDDHLYYVLMGWGKGEEAWALKYGKIIGNPSDKEPWDELDRMISFPYQHANGHKIYIQYTLVDLGGNKTEYVRAYCKKRKGNNVVGIHGSNKGAASPFIQLTTAVNSRTAEYKHVNVGVHRIKDMLFERLAIDIPGKRFIHTSDFFGEDFYRQLLGERKFHEKGRDIYKPYPSSSRHEVLDCVVYNYAALHLFMERWNLDNTCEARLKARKLDWKS